MTMPGDDDERASEAERLVLELAEVRKRMQARAEQPRRAASGSYRAVTSEKAPLAKTVDDDDAPPPTRRRPG
ncbi:MAG: hypothetical protein ABI175_14175 [Polyangiales bacterium]